MARQQRKSATLQTAVTRISGMRAIDPNLDYGYGLNLADYEARINVLRTKLSNYNTLLITLDACALELNTLEQDLRTYAENMLLSTAVRYGKDSLQYMHAGGKIRKPGKRSTAAQKASNPTPQTIPTTPTTATLN